MTSASIEVRSNPHCLVCNSRVSVSTRNSYQIFNNQVQTCSERPVNCIMSTVLGKELTETNVHSLIICKKCFKLFNEVDELEMRVAEVKVELIGNYKRSVMKYKKNGNSVMPVELEDIKEDSQEDDKEALQNNLKKKILDIPSSDDEQQEGSDRAQVLEDIESQLERLHNEDAVKDDEEQKMEITNNEDGVIEIHIEQESSGSFHGFEVQTEETIDAGAMDNSEDSDYEPPVGIKQSGMHNGQDVDNTSALLEAAALAEQSLNEDGTEVITIKMEPGLEEAHRIDRRRTQHMVRKTQKKVIKEEYLEPIVSREGNLYTCLACESDEKFMGEPKAIMMHVKNEHELRVYICDVCGQDFRKRNELSMHLDEHVATEEGDFQCEVCNRIFSNLRLFRIHKRMHYPQSKLWTCETCGKRYSSRNLLEEHINTHTGIRPYVCKTCGKDFASKYTYKAHEKTHEVRPRPFQCSHCPKSFLSQQNLTQHERTHSGIKEYVCHLCGKAFGSPHNLEVHSIVHTGYKPYVCGICGKAFARKAEIRDHERTHTGERPYQCEFCGATFSQRSNLQSHKRATHYDDKRYKCQACGKGFKRRRLLDYHMKAAHTGERPFKCNVCDATFVYPEHFKKHRRIHTGEKPFLCEVCGKAFNSRDNRNAHRFVHSDKKPYECLVCGMGFMRKPLLYAHMQTQGHLNDTIVVNQPRLTTDDDQIVTVNADGEMELVEHEVGRLEHIGSEGEDGEASEDTKLYIAELKEHVIIQDGELYGNSKGAMIVGESLDGDTTVQDAVKHLIIDGQQIQFADQDDEDSESHHVLTTQHIINGEYEEVVADELVEGDTQTIHTSTGSIQLVQIRVPSADGEEEEEAWVKIVPE